MPPAERTGPSVGSARPVLAVAGLALLIVVAAATGAPWSFTERLPIWGAPDVAANPQPINLPSGLPLPTTTTDPSLPLWLTVSLWVLLAAIAGALGYLIWRRFPRRTIRPDDAVAAPVQGDVQPNVRRLQEGALTALDLLDQIADPKDAVIRAWTALEGAAERSGSPRDPAATPSEFTAAVLTRTAADPTAVQTLLALYHQARFSSHPVGMAEVRSARSCVLELSRTWRSYDDALRASVL